jgi:hypothetical protein
MGLNLRRSANGPSQTVLADAMINELLKEAIADRDRRSSSQECEQSASPSSAPGLEG